MDQQCISKTSCGSLTVMWLVNCHILQLKGDRSLEAKDAVVL